jgi:hypothetical protein
MKKTTTNAFGAEMPVQIRITHHDICTVQRCHIASPCGHMVQPSDDPRSWAPRMKLPIYGYYGRERWTV